MLLFAMDSSLRWNDENRPVQRSPMRTLLAALVLLLAFAGQAWAQGDGLNGSYWNFNVVANGNAFPTGAANRTPIDPPVDFNWGTGTPPPGIGRDDLRRPGSAGARRRRPAATCEKE